MHVLKIIAQLENLFPAAVESSGLVAQWLSGSVPGGSRSAVSSLRGWCSHRRPTAAETETAVSALSARLCCHPAFRRQKRGLSCHVACSSLAILSFSDPASVLCPVQLSYPSHIVTQSAQPPGPGDSPLGNVLHLAVRELKIPTSKIQTGAHHAPSCLLVSVLSAAYLIDFRAYQRHSSDALCPTIMLCHSTRHTPRPWALLSLY